MPDFSKDNQPSKTREGCENKHSKAIKDAAMATANAYVGEGDLRGLEGFFGLLMHTDPRTFASILKAMIAKEVNAKHEGKVDLLVKSMIECVDAKG